LLFSYTTGLLAQYLKKHGAEQVSCRHANYTARRQLPEPLGSIEKRSLIPLPVPAIAPVILVVLTVVTKVASLAERGQVGIVVIGLIVVDMRDR